MNWIEQMNGALSYIEEHIEEELTVEVIAKVAMYSPSHFSRVFNFLSDTSLKAYIRSRRLTLAAVELRDKDCRVLDIALKYGYETPEAFTKAFKKFHGIVPSKVYNFEGPLNVTPAMSFSVVMKGEKMMEYKIIEKTSFDVVGVKRNVSTVNGENFKIIPQFWQEVMKDGTFNAINGAAKSLGTLGVITDYVESTSAFDYYIACEGNHIEGIDYDTYTVPAGKYAVFTTRGPLPEAIQGVFKKIYNEFFPSTNYEHAGTAELEVYLPGDPSQDDYESEIWIPIK